MTDACPTAPALIEPSARGGARGGAMSGAKGGVWRALRRGLMTTAGAAVIVLGFVIAPLPGPMGLPVALAGLVLVLRNATWAKRLFVRAQRRWPNWVYPVRRLMRPKPQIAPVLWKSMLHSEKLVGRGRLKVLAPLRRSLLRRRQGGADRAG